MKKSDWTMIIFVAVVVGFVSFMVTNSLVGEERKPVETVKTTIVFSDRVDEPNSYIFRVNDFNAGSSINPTVPITTGSGTETKTEEDIDSDKSNTSGDKNNSEQDDL